MPKRLRYYQRRERFPPVLMRLLATRGRGRAARWLTDKEIADACGLPVCWVKFLSFAVDWKQVPGDVEFRFLMGCDLDIEKRRTFRRIEWMRRFGHFPHIRTPEEKARAAEMFDVWEGAR